MAIGPTWILATAALTIVAGPLALGLAGFISARAPHAAPAAPVPGWRLTAASTLLYVLAFNLTFFLQELALVLPKALTPGLQPTLYHNNHSWEGTNPLAALFQGTGALATLAVGLFCLWLLRRPRPWSNSTRLVLFWMAYCGCFMALPQVVVGALSPGSDVGMAMGYLQLDAGARLGAGLLALGLMPLVALLLRQPALAIADSPAAIGSPGARTRFVFRTATLPALLATALVIPFRIPREWLEVVLVPLLVVLPGIPWIQAGAWRTRGAAANGAATTWPLAYLFAAVVALLLFFQLVLRAGIRFY
ncbi:MULTISPECIES: hypothetical protein [Rhodanobacter]|uniref:hypothetical protein n=1 Tax=Rhodanobacter TaxID=75309 RepID=UPI000429CCFB|nr:MULTISPECIES: hypothetical protein [Rhodanobacter]UJJ49628.1 hypothetical protein LRK52_10310 [Rhodanobacter denitrificans]UJM92342.1 hypothetical protein LRK32_10225 [Rhodanobacter denitrificans]UJM95871.1 hypothetical protein LRK44_10230 [Rhodanobacter denitrificans]UJN21298.1 hypothetical protein LRK54_16410 [Rhodanobacter denitrificans]